MNPVHIWIGKNVNEENGKYKKWKIMHFSSTFMHTISTIKVFEYIHLYKYLQLVSIAIIKLFIINSSSALWDAIAIK